MNINLTSICSDLLVVQLDNGVLDVSWSVDTDTLKKSLQDEGIQKILDLQNKIDFIIEIDNVDTFDSINKYNTADDSKSFIFSSLKQTYRGNVVYSAIIPFNKDKFEETNYYVRVKVRDEELSCTVVSNNEQDLKSITFVDTWSDTHSFVIRKDYTKDLVETMYAIVADFNAYNKEVKSANFYYLFQAIATSLNQEFNYIQDQKNRLFINKSLPDFLRDTFGVLFKFNDATNISMEEYRRILKSLIIAYQHGGAWNYIKEVLKYLIGCTPELVTFNNFYPWVLRKAEISSYNTDGTPIYNWNRPDPVDFSDRTYYNPESNYYLFEKDFLNKYQSKNKNSIMLMDGSEKNFTFIVKSDNFFNVTLDVTKIKSILNLLKSVYTKYSLNITDYLTPSATENYILISDDYILLADDENYIRY